MTSDDASPSTEQPDPPAVTSRPLWRRVVHVVRWIIAVPTWIAVLGIAIAVILAWLIPVDATAESQGRVLVNAAIFGVRVFQTHLLFASLALVTVALLTWRRRLVIAALLLAASLGSVELLRVLPAWSRPNAEGPTLRVAAINLYFFNTDLDAIESYIREVDPDVIAFSEFSRVHSSLIDRLAETYPHFVLPRGIFRADHAVLAKQPIFHAASDDGRLNVSTFFDGAPLVVSAVHHRSPGDIWTVQRNLRQTSELVDSLPELESEGVFLGDFNASRWTPQISSLRGAGLTEAHDASRFGLGLTWPAKHPRHAWTRHILGLRLGVRIDHIFTTPGLVAVDAGVGTHVGSDHLPVWADLRRVDP